MSRMSILSTLCSWFLPVINLFGHNVGGTTNTNPVPIVSFPDLQDSFAQPRLMRCVHHGYPNLPRHSRSNRRKKAMAAKRRARNK